MTTIVVVIAGTRTHAARERMIASRVALSLSCDTSTRRRFAARR